MCVCTRHPTGTFDTPFRKQWVTGRTPTGRNAKTHVAISITTDKQTMVTHFPLCPQSTGPNPRATGHLGHCKLTEVKYLEHSG